MKEFILIVLILLFIVACSLETRTMRRLETYLKSNNIDYMYYSCEMSICTYTKADNSEHYVDCHNKTCKPRLYADSFSERR